MRFIPVGFTPRYIRPRPAWLADPRVTHIRSVSTCISPAPERWIDAWRHNDLGFFDTPALAQEIAASLPADEEGALEIHAYQIWDTRIDEGVEQAIDPPLTEAPPVPEGWTLLGYDAVSRSYSDFFECSPLTCNHRSPDFAVNAHGLMETAAAARAAAHDFSLGGGESGDYYVVEIWRC